MSVYIIDTEVNHIKRYQIMTKANCGFNHVYPGKMFSLGAAIELCGKQGYNVVAIGNIWRCADR